MNDSNKKLLNECPDNSHFLRLFSTKSSEKEKEILIDHILRCRKCKKKFEALKELKALETSDTDSLEFNLSRKEASDLIRHAEVMSDQYPNRNVRSQGFRFRIPKSIIIGLFIVLISAVVLYFSLEHRSAIRTSNPFGLKLLTPKTEVTKAPKRFKWTQVENADRYALTIIDEDMNTLYPPHGSEGKISTSLFEVPDSIRSQLIPQITYVWTIEAFDEFNNFLTSESKSFVIK
jgi:hypothetical protein